MMKRMKFVAVLSLVMFAFVNRMTFAQTKTAPAASSSIPSPLSLADPDGQGLILEALEVRTAISGPLSLTEIEMRFRNPQSRVVEGRFDATLPADASISRFAKEIGGRLMEGEVVERQHAHQVYEQYLHVTRRDPALLEQDQGNRFSARIFPIQPREQIRLLLSYTQLLAARDGKRQWRFPMRGLPRMASFSFRGTIAPLDEAKPLSKSGVDGPSGATIESTQVARLEERDYLPERDLELSWDLTDSAPVTVLRAGEFYIASLRAASAATTRAAELPLVLYVDTSASSAPSAMHRIDAITEILKSLPAQRPVELIAFDLSMKKLAGGRASEVATQASALLRERLFLGGTNVEQVLTDIGARSRKGERAHYVIVSDGVATFGETADGVLLQKINTLMTTRVDAVVIGDRRAPLLKLITRGRGRIIDVPLTDRYPEHARRAAADLVAPLGVSATLRDSNAEWIYPAEVDDLRVDREVIVVGRLRGGAAPQLAATIGNASALIPMARQLPNRSFETLLRREGFRAYLEYLGEREMTERDGAIKQAIALQRVQLSVAERILIPSTTMLVLETEFDYQRFGLQRHALASILTVGASGIELAGRSDPNVRVTSVPPQQPVSPKAAAPMVGSIVGTVRDSAGNAISGTIVLSGASSATVPANQQGAFNLPGLRPGSYIVRFESSGYEPQTTRVEIRPSQTVTLNAQLTRRREQRRIQRRQNNEGQLFGVVTHEGGPLPGTTVSISSPALSGTRVAVTGVDGSYSFFVPAGEYTVRFEMEGMSSATMRSRVAAGRQSRADGNLTLTTVSEAITVTAADPRSGRAPQTMVENGGGVSVSVNEPLRVTAATLQVLETTQIRSNMDAELIDGLPVGRSMQSVQSLSASASQGIAQIPSRPSNPSLTVDDLEKALARQPDSRDLYTTLSEMLVRRREWRKLREVALRWQPYDFENAQVYEALGEAALGLNDQELALRAFSSLAEVAASRPELLQRSGLLMLRAGGGPLAEAPLRHAIALRPDRVNSHRHLAIVLWHQRRYAEAAEVLEGAIGQSYQAWYGDVQRVLREELGYIYRGWIASDPQSRRDVELRAAEHQIDLTRTDALRVTMAWETDANDVDLHVVDPAGERCFYSRAVVPSGLELYSDVTQGLGPEVIRTATTMRGTYTVGVNYFNPGPMGVSRGVLVIVRNDGKTKEPRPEVIPFRLVPQSFDEPVQDQNVRMVAKVTF